MKSVYLVEQRYYDDEAGEALGAFSTLEKAKTFCQKRAGITVWAVHNSHGALWRSGGYTIVEVQLDP